MVLAPALGGDVVFRLLTSKPHGRQESPPCCHADPYPSFYLGVLGGKLGKKSWLDLRKCDDYEDDAFRKSIADGVLTQEGMVPLPALCGILECVAVADDTTRAQTKSLRDEKSRAGSR